MAEHAEAEAATWQPAALAQTPCRPAVPGIVFDNGTPFDALQFDTIDQHGAAFHVFVARGGYRIGVCGGDGFAQLTALDVPARLNTEDRHVDGDPAASVLEESDLAPFKPRCDVIVNSVAHAPRGKPTRRFLVGLRVERPNDHPSGDGQVAAQDAGALVDKALMVCGARSFQRKAFITRLLQSLASIATLGLLRPGAWRLGKAAELTKLALRYEYASGGQCRIDGDDAAARRVPARHYLPAARDGSLAPGRAIAHEACESNPVGRGFARNWYLRALRIRRVPAPQISYAAQPISARQFQTCAGGGDLPPPAGLGAVGRAWLPRRALIGQVRQQPDWGADEVPALPTDFDYGYWNCAPGDQQCAWLRGGDAITLVNLCVAGSPAARTNQRGNTLLRFKLPRQAVYAIAADSRNQLTVVPLEVDTVIINPETLRVDLVWRANLMAHPDLVEARLMHATRQDQLERLASLIQYQWSDTSTTR